MWKRDILQLGYNDLGEQRKLGNTTSFPVFSTPVESNPQRPTDSGKGGKELPEQEQRIHPHTLASIQYFVKIEQERTATSCQQQL